jgi:hypothetical protein
MPATLRSRQAFSAVDLLTTIVLLGMAFALLAPTLEQQREEARRTQCTNNLKLIGLAIQNFHDIRQEVCPSYLTTDPKADGPCNAEGYATWCILLLPFMEQQNLYDLVDLKTPLTTDLPTGKRPDAHKLVRATSVPVYFCPSRREPPLLTADDEGSVGDYASVTYGGARRIDGDRSTAVNLGQPRTFDGAMLVCRAFNASDAPNTAPINGFQPGTLGAADYRAMTTFASVLDGLSNTALIGEKAVHKNRLGQGKTDASQQDGTVYFGVGATRDSYVAPGPMAYWSRRMASEKEGASILASNNEDPENRFGGWHPGVTLFVLGDGSVQVVRNDEDNVALQRLGTRNDRMTFDLKKVAPTNE